MLAGALSIVLFLVFACGQSVLIQPVDKAAAGFLQKPKVSGFLQASCRSPKCTEVSPFEAGMLSRRGLDTSQTDAPNPKKDLQASDEEPSAVWSTRARNRTGNAELRPQI